MTDHGEKRVPFHVHELWKQVETLLQNDSNTLSDYEGVEKSILSLGKNAADHSSFFRKASTQKVYSEFKGVKSLEELLEKLNPSNHWQLHL